MPTSDAFNVTGAYDKPAGYNKGDLITLGISGGDVQTVTTQETVGPVVLHLKAQDGATTDLTTAATTVTNVTTSPESVIIEGYTDTNPNPRVWTIAADGIHVTTPS